MGGRGWWRQALAERLGDASLRRSVEVHENGMRIGVVGLGGGKDALNSVCRGRAETGRVRA